MSKSVTVESPCAGILLPLSEVPDPVFAQEILGPGVALSPALVDTNVIELCAPISGTLTKVMPHAYVITDDGLSVLVHAGIDTVGLKGDGFTILTPEGSEVTAGTPIIRWNVKVATAAGLDLSMPVIGIDSPGTVENVPAPGTFLSRGQELFVFTYSN